MPNGKISKKISKEIEVENIDLIDSTDINNDKDKRGQSVDGISKSHGRFQLNLDNLKKNQFKSAGYHKANSSNNNTLSIFRPKTS